MSAEFFCPCREPAELNSSSIPTLIGEKWCSFNLLELLFCTSCQAVRCPFCTIEEPIAWYCDLCSIELNATQASDSSNKCPYCVQCSCGSCSFKTLDPTTIQCRGCRSQYPIYSESRAESVKIMFDAKLQKLVAPLTDFGSDGSRESNSVDIIEFVESLELDDSENLNDSTNSKNSKSLKSSNDSDNSNDSNDSSNTFHLNLVQLRAKWKKKCRYCDTVLLKHFPKRLLDYETRHEASEMLPNVEAHLVDGVPKLVFFNNSKKDMQVRLACTNEQVTVSSNFNCPARSSLSTFPAPLFMVNRETVASRKAFMNGESKLKHGSGWAVVDVEFEESGKFNEPLVFFMAVKIKAQQTKTNENTEFTKEPKSKANNSIKNYKSLVNEHNASGDSRENGHLGSWFTVNFVSK